MAIRYVWEKWNRSTKQCYGLMYDSPPAVGSSFSRTFKKISVDEDTGTITLSEYLGSKDANPGYGSGVGTTTGRGSTLKQVITLSDASNYYLGRKNAIEIIYDYYQFGENTYKSAGVWAEQYTKKIKGSTSYGFLSSASASAYPDNSYSGSYWYVKSGQDTIDPVSVTYDESTLVAGQKVTVTISPSTGNTYGGTIAYQVEVNVDEIGWEVLTQTTSTSVDIDIPADAVSWRVRVLASDDMGFTSSDYVYGNNATETPSTVIYPSVFAVMPEDKNLGYLASSTILTYLVTTDDSVNYSITVTLDDEEISTATEAPKARTLVLADDTWDGLSSEGVHTLVMTVTQGDDQIVRTFQFRKFVYDYSNLNGLLTGIARATRIKRSFNKQIVAANLPKEILKISSVKEDITPSYIDVTIPYAPGGTIVATYASGDTYGADVDQSGVTRVVVDHKGYYTLRGYVGNSPSSSASVTIENDGDMVTAVLQWIKLTVTIESGASVVATCGEYSVSGTSNGTVDLYLPISGTWTLKATKSSYGFSVTDTVSIGGYGNFTAVMEFINPNFAANSWETIQKVVQAGKAASYWNVGDSKAVTLNGTVG